MTDLKAAVFTVLEGWALPLDARKILETAYYAQPEPVQVRPHEFIAMASKQADMVGKPVVWAEYPTPHKIILDEGWEWGHEARTKKAEVAKPEQEPIGWFLKDHLETYMESYKDIEGAIPLYTAPPRKPWVGLTNDEINDFSAGCHLGKSVQSAICQAAAKLKELNK
jgi:hypothetical protein